ncbi:MAG: intermembrane transport protein PqiB [Syntrophobacteraceae bacterium]
MTETPVTPQMDDIPEAVAVPHRHNLPLVWIIPLVAALIGGWLAVKTLLERGPTITITFKTAEGLEAGKTQVKYKDVNIGLVTAVTLSDQFTKVLVTAQIEKHATGLLVDDAKFWLVQPRVTLSGVSGLGTLLSGNYIGFEAGKSEMKRLDFAAMDVPPIVTGGQAGRQFLLRSETLGSLGFGSPIYFRRLPVGQVVGYDLAEDGGSVNIKLFVNAPYDAYVTEQTRFWNASGIDMSLSANGVDLRTESLASVLVGGIAFEAPPHATANDPALADHVFTLYGSRAIAMRKPDYVVEHYVLRFTESVRGLSVGAPVTVFGFQIGEVTDFSLEAEPETGAFGSKVTVAMYPGRVAELRKAGEPVDKKTRREFIRQLVEEGGLRAQLKSGNLLTGQLYVALAKFPDAAKIAVDWTQEPPQLPTVPGNLEDLEAKISTITAKLAKVPLDELVSDLRKAIGSLDQTLRSANKVLVKVDAQVVPGVRASLDELRRALTTAEKAMSGVETNLVGTDAPVQQELQGALQELNRAARSARNLFDYLDRNPSALIRGKQKENP